MRRVFKTRQFAKWMQANVSSAELEALQWLAKQLLDLNGRQLEVAEQDGS